MELNTPSDLLASPDHYAFIEGLAKRAAHNVARRYRTDVEDLTQEALKWCLEHPAKFMEYWGDENQKRGERYISAAMRNACKDYAHSQLASEGGSDNETSFWYRGELIEELLGYIWDEASWTTPPQTEVKTRGGDPALGNGWIATLADVKRAVEKQSEYDQWLLRLYYHARHSQADIASSHADQVSQQQIGRRLKRALGRVREALGGRPPHRDPAEPGWQEYVGSRKVLSNAAARAQTGNDYGGE